MSKSASYKLREILFELLSEFWFERLLQRLSDPVTDVAPTGVKAFAALFFERMFMTPYERPASAMGRN